MTATHPAARRTRKTSPRTHYQRRLPRLGWWWLVVALIAAVIAKNHPYWTGLAVVLLAAGLILRAIRPARLARLWHLLDRAAEHRRALPVNAHHRTIDTFQRMTPGHFEHAIAELALEDPRVHSAQAVGQTNDRGADVIVQFSDGGRVMIQCKRYRNGNNVGSEDVQKTNGTYRDIHGCHAAVIVTTAGYTRAAYDTNAMLPQPIRLIDGPALQHWATTGQAPW